MTFPGFFDIARGSRNFEAVHKFGHNQALGTTYEPIAAGGFWRTPQVSGATALRVAAGNVNDDNAGSGAWEVQLEGVDASGEHLIELVTLAGTSASSATSGEFLRLFRVAVTKSGTYGTATATSHAAAITIENAAGTEDWAIVPFDDFGHGRSQIGVYTVPLGHTAFLFGYSIEAEGNKPTDVALISRANILDTAAPYSSIEYFQEEIGITGEYRQNFDIPVRFEALTDIGAMARSSQSANVSIDFELVVIEGLVWPT